MQILARSQANPEELEERDQQQKWRTKNLLKQSRGQDFERNERQRKDFEEMNKGAGESFQRLAWGGPISISVVILIAWAVRGRCGRWG